MKHTRYRRRDILRLFGTGCVITLCVVMVHVMRPELLIHFEHKVYDRTGEPCVACGTPMPMKRGGGRSSHFCPKCQKKPRAR